MKLGDDVEEIDLDVTLERYQTAKQFLFKILTQLAEPHGIKVKDIVNEGAKDRLVLASGGVARDFVSILRKSIAIAQERGQIQVNTEHVNQAAGEHESTKRDEFRQDVLEGESELEKEFDRIKKFCLTDKKVNCFIIEKDLNEPVYDHVKELVDLRLLHAVALRVTTAGHCPGRIYEAYMIDISQYAGERKRRDLDLLPFWKQEGKGRLRRAGLILSERA